GLLPAEYTALSRKHLEAVAATGAQVVLVGSGRRQIFLDPGIIAEMGARGVGVEVMGTAAACRCYNVLASEHRAVAAVLYIS
ncbi:MAG: MTH938/NDUFAF3 family protein, partial [Gammaproteobacteria bacterium]